MPVVTRSEIQQITGHIDEDLVIGIVDTGATATQLTEAFGWFMNSDAMREAGHRRPDEAVSRLIDILESTETPDERE